MASAKIASRSPLDFSARTAIASITAGQGSQARTSRAPRIGASSKAESARNPGWMTATATLVTALM
ncbi:MAG: hypothetical protein E5V95_21675 [Mesorhizobium sp.]|nr:MAG: hypothetical protein E5V95_21675 [Mesorhizobium sp.]